MAAEAAKKLKDRLAVEEGAEVLVMIYTVRVLRRLMIVRLLWCPYLLITDDLVDVQMSLSELSKAYAISCRRRLPVER